jgi:two-component system, chemotaxis family, protein-glutamate methylesterase/glutaminase
MNDAINVFIIDDSAVVRTTIGALVEHDKNILLMGSASDPIMAEEKFRKNGWPDVIILDIEMPRMDGLTFLKKVMRERPTPIIICSSVAQKGSKYSVEALSYGAVEVISKPEMGIKEFLEESKGHFLYAIKAAAKSKARMPHSAPKASIPISAEDLNKNSADAMLPLRSKMMGATQTIVAIGSSTGGVQILERILKALPEKIPPVVVTQHMPAGFTKSLAERLDSICNVTVKEAEHGDKLLYGRVLLAPGDKHMMVKRQGNSFIVEIKDGPKVSRHKPSVDVLFRSCANEAGGSAYGFILTGMGDDGARGLREMRDSGAKTYSQDEASCIVYGMPKAAVEMGASMGALTPEQIVEIIKKG